MRQHMKHYNRQDIDSIFEWSRKANEAAADSTMIAAEFERELNALQESSDKYLSVLREVLSTQDEDEEDLCHHCGEDCGGTCPAALEWSDDHDDQMRSNRINLGFYWG